MISVFHDSSTYSENGMVSPKVSSPTNLRKNIQIFPQKFFDGVSVFLRIKDNYLYNKIKIALEDSGAIIMSEIPYMADYIISESPISIPVFKPSRSRGSRLVALASGTTEQSYPQNPKIILLKQIPWALLYKKEQKTIKKLNSIPEKISIEPKETMPDFDPNLIVVANGIDAPIFKKIDKFPQLFLDPSPKGYQSTPFEPIRKDAEEVAKAQQNFVPKPKEQPEPPSYSLNNDWHEFDQLCEELNENFFDY